MPLTLMHWFAVCLCGVLSVATAVFYRALRSASSARLEEINRQRKLYASLPDFDSALIATGWLKVLVYAAYAAAVAFLLYGKRGGGLVFYAASTILAAASLLAIEVAALVSAGYHSGRVFYNFLPLVAALAAAGAAVRYAGGVLAGLVARVSGWEPPLGPREAAEEQILDAVTEGRHRGVIAHQESEMIESIIEFKDSAVSQISTPRTKVVTVVENATVAQALETAIASGHSRLPVRAQSAEEIIGVLHVKDALRLAGSEGAATTPVRDIMRSPYFVPETKRIRELLQEFRATNVHMAIVLDEYGGTAGIVTIEDVLEKIVGQIEDEYQPSRLPAIRVLAAGSAVAEGQARLRDVNEALQAKLSESEDYETLAGYLLSRLGRIPAPGEGFDFQGVSFKVLDADARRIKRLAIETAQHRPDQRPAPKR